jgi:hypothetical protein
MAGRAKRSDDKATGGPKPSGDPAGVGAAKPGKPGGPKSGTASDRPPTAKKAKAKPG